MPISDAFLAVDTETTGLNTRVPESHYDNPSQRFACAARPFIVTACDHVGTTWFWRFHVDPYTRIVDYASPNALQRIAEITSLLQFYPRLVFHNAKFDVRMLSLMGIDLTHRWTDIDDTLAGAHVLDSKESHGLKDQGIKYLGILDTDEEILKRKVKEARDAAKKNHIPRGPGVGTDYFLPYQLLNDTSDEIYATRDAIRTVLLHKLQRKELDRQNLVTHYERERRVLQVTYEMEERGVHIRPIAFSSERRKYHDLRASALRELQRIAAIRQKPSFNPNSYKQLTELLYDHFHLPVIARTKGGGPSTDRDTVEQLTTMAEDIHDQGAIHPVWLSWYKIESPRARKLTPAEREHWRMVSVFLQSLQQFADADTGCTYLDLYHEHSINGYIYSTFNPWATGTTRFSSSAPNMQNVGKQSRVPLRYVFGPPRGKIWYAIDYNQLELRLMAKASGDPTLTRVLAEGLDRHQITADALSVPRKQAKNINFAWQYGAGANKLSLMAGIPALEFKVGMETAYPGVVRFMETCMSVVKQNYRLHKIPFVETLFGYRLVVPLHESYKGTNYVIQGTAGDLMKNALIAIREYLTGTGMYSRVYPILSIHDEIVFEADADVEDYVIADIADIMEQCGAPIDCYVPVEVSKIATSWDKATKPHSLNRNRRTRK